MFYRPRMYVGLAVAISISLTLKCSGPEQRQTDTTAPAADRSAGPLIIGAVLPLTGDAAAFGVNAQRGATLAVEEAAASAGFPIKLIVEDSRGTADLAASAGRKLLSVDRASVMIGDVTSAGTQALLPLVTARKVALISPAASDPSLSGKSPFFARVWPSDIYEAEVIANYAESQKMTRIAVLYANTDYGVAMAKQFQRSLPQGRIALALAAERQTLDYRTLIQRIISAKPDALFVIMYPEDSRRLLQQLREARFSVPILATATLDDPSVAAAAKGFNIVFASPAAPGPTDTARARFVAAYRKKYGAEPGILADTGYDCAALLIEARRRTNGNDAAAMTNYIRSLKGWDGASGQLTFDQNGDVRKPYALKTVKDGAFVWK